MQVSQFESAPTKNRHPVYEDSMLYSTAPEWSTGEVLLAAAYRRLILGVSESNVDLENIEQVPAAMPAARPAGPAPTMMTSLMSVVCVISFLRVSRAPGGTRGEHC